MKVPYLTNIDSFSALESKVLPDNLQPDGCWEALLQPARLRPLYEVELRCPDLVLEAGARPQTASKRLQKQEAEGETGAYRPD